MSIPTAAEMAARVRARTISPRELVEAALAAIERLNPSLNAFVTVDGERALAEADAIRPGDERPLAGVPIGVKDFATLAKGLRLTNGSDAFGDFVPDRDCEPIRRLRAAGAILIGRTNVPELALRPVTEPRRYGPTRNPWNRERGVGGSSGGSGCAVAAGMVPLATGNDLGGSLRIPAACCGVVGLKPSRGRVSAAPSGELALGFATEGAIARTVLDAALALDVLAGPVTGDAYWAPPPREPFVHAVSRPPGRLRVAFWTRAPSGAAAHPAVEGAVRDTAARLATLGHDVDERVPDWADARLPPAWETLFPVAYRSILDDMIEAGAAMDIEALEPASRAIVSEPLPALADFLRALETLRRCARRMVALWDERDVLLLPTVSRPAPPIGSIRPEDPPDFAPFTGRWNITGQPAISLPVAWTEDGVPVGVQLVGPPAGEELLLSLAAQLEAELGWAARVPQPA